MSAVPCYCSCAQFSVLIVETSIRETRRCPVVVHGSRLYSQVMNESTNSQSVDAAVFNQRFLHLVRVVGFVEGVSTLILFGIAMPLKYLADMPLAVRVAGTVHGLLFTLPVALLMLGISRIPLRRSVAVVGVLAAVIPFGPFIYDRWLVQSAQS